MVLSRISTIIVINVKQVLMPNLEMPVALLVAINNGLLKEPAPVLIVLMDVIHAQMAIHATPVPLDIIEMVTVNV